MGLAGHATNEVGNYYAMGVQSAKDVDASTFYFFKYLDGTGFDVEFDVSSEREGGAGREISLRYKTMVKADGQVVAYARPDAAGRMLTWALGSDVPSAAASGLTSHLITPGGSLPYLTADQNWADETERTTNCVVTDTKIEGEAGKPIKITQQFISGGSPHIATAVQTAVLENAQPFMEPGASAWLNVGATGSGATSIEITKWSLDIKNSVDDGIQTLGLNREDVIWQNVEFDLDATLKYTDNKIWNQVNYGGGTQVPVALATAAFGFFTPAIGGPGSLEMGAPTLQVAAAKVNRLDPDGKTMYLDITAMTIKGATNSVFAKVQSGATASYVLPTT